MGRVTLNGYLDVPADRLDDVRAALPDHIRLTRAEPDCISFGVTETASHPVRFEVAEVFASRAGFEHHQKRTAASPWAEITHGFPRHYATTGLEE